MEEVKKIYPVPDDVVFLPNEDLLNWICQIAVIGFNSGKYDLNMIKQYFLERIAEDALDKIKVAKKYNNYMFLTTPRFKFLDIKNFLASGMSYEKWCKSLKCELEKLVFFTNG